ncbi:MAG TPA: hypothetical protein VF044_02260, partial [Actinomycetota bacterium]
VDEASINGDELRLTGAAAANFQLGAGNVPLLDTSMSPTGVVKLNATTWRYYLKPKVGTPTAPVTLVPGALTIEIAATIHNTTSPSWRVENTNASGVGLGTYRNGSAGSGTVTLSETAQGATASGNVAIGPLYFSLPTFSLVDTKFKDGTLTLTIGIEVAEAGLAFGAPATGTGGPSAQQQSSGMGARLTGILGTFDVNVDLMRAVQGLTNPSELLAAFSVPGKWGLKVAGLEVLVPDVLRITGSNIVINYDPNAAASVPIVTVGSASIEFPTFGITGSITDFRIRRNGFDLGSFEIKYRPGGTTNTVGTNGPQTIRFGSILELDDIRIGVTNFSVTFGQAIDFDGTIYIASGGVKLMPGSAFNATITDREGVETGPFLPGQTANNTEAIRAALEFENGRVKAFQFKADTMRIQLGSFVTLTAKDFFLDTGADATEELVAFTSLGAEVTVGGLKIGGEARNFAFMGDGSFRTKPGFGVFLSVGSSDASGFKWPSWLPVRINAIGIEWPNIQADPGNFVLTLSVSVTEIKGIGGLEFSGSIEGVKIDVGKLLNGEFPIVEIASIGVQVKGTMFGGQIEAALIGGILKLNDAGQIIDPTDTTTPVADRVLFFGLEGKFNFSGIGVGIRLALSELGPLTVQLSASLPTGIMLIPQIGLVMNDFTAGVEFFKTLPSIDQPEELRKPDFQAPGGMSVDQWLSTVKNQVAAQYRAIKANPSMNGFAAAFTAPMTITGSAKIYSLYTSKQVFNGQVTIKFSTDGKILIIGTLNFADDNLSISGRVYADLSRVSQGDVTVLFLADIPDQVRVLTLKGRLKMGFRDATGQEVEFVVPDEAPFAPTPVLAGPRPGDTISIGEINGRGYLDVVLPGTFKIDLPSVTDLAPEFTISTPGVALDQAQRPVLLNESQRRFRYWTKGNLAPGTAVEITFTKDGFAMIDLTGQKVGNEETTVTIAAGDAETVNNGYVDVLFRPTADRDVDATTLNGDEVAIDGVTILGSPMNLPGTNLWRYFFRHDFAADQTVEVELPENTWRDSSGAQNVAGTGSFEVVAATGVVAAPFPNGTVDVAVVNADRDGGFLYVDLIFDPTPGTDIDYASVFDAGDEFSISYVGGGAVDFDGTPIAIALLPDEDGILVATEFERESGESDADYYDRLKIEGVQRFRYRAASASTSYAPGTLTVSLLAHTSGGDGWADSGGNGSLLVSKTVAVEGPTANTTDPATGAAIDLNAINGRNYIDIEFPAADAGLALDEASVLDGAPEFRLEGEGVGTIGIDGLQAPVHTAGSTYRYWLTGAYVAGSVSVVLLPGSWRYLVTDGGSDATITIDDPEYLDVAFAAPTGYVLDTASITDLAAEFAVSVASGTIALDTTVAPLAGSTPGTYRFRVTGTFTQGSDVTVDFTDGTWALLPDPASLTPDDRGDLTSTNSRTWLDVTYRPTADRLAEDESNPSDPFGADALADIDGDEFTLSGAGAATVDFDSAEAEPLHLGNGRYRYFLTGDFVKGEVLVDFLADSFSVAAISAAKPEYGNRAEQERFLVVGPTGDLVDPVDGGSTGLDSLNNRGYLDVAIVTPAGHTLDLASVTDLDPEFTILLGGAATTAIRLDATQAPVLLSQAGNTYTFRFWTIGTHTAGDVTLSFLTESAARGYALLEADGDPVVNTATGPVAPVNFTVGGVATPNVSYLDIRFTPTSGDEIDAASVEDAGDELLVTNENGSTVALLAAAPTRLPGTNVWRYYLAGSFAAGSVTVELLEGTFASGAHTNLGEEESFLAQQLTGDLVDPPAGSIVGDGDLNDRGFFDVDYTAPAGHTLDLDSVLDLEHEFTVTGITLDATRAPLLIGEPTGGVYKIRYFYTGATPTAPLTLTFVAGSYSFLDASTDPVAPTETTRDVTVPDLTYIDVRFNGAGDSDLDEDSIDGDELTFSGSGATGVTVSSDPLYAPTVLADGRTVRYYLAGAFVPGTVRVAFVAGSWRDEDGNLGTGETESFQTIEVAEPTTPHKVFFIDISGALELRLADLFPEPLLEIRGKVTLEIGVRTLPDGSQRGRFTLDASGTIKLIDPIGNIA